MSISTFVIFALCCGCLAYWLNRRFSRRLFLASKFNGPKAYFLAGNAHMFLNKNPMEYVDIMTEVTNNHGLIMRFWMATKLVIVLLDPEHIKIVLTDEKSTKKADEYRYMKPFHGDGIIGTEGKLWASHIKIITPALNNMMLSSYLRVFDKETMYFIEKIDKYANGKAFDIYPHISLLSLDMISKTCMGLSLNFQDGENDDFNIATKCVNKILCQRMFDLLLGIDLIFKFTQTSAELKKHLKLIHDFCDKVILERREKLLTANVSDRVFLDILLESNIDGVPLSNKAIRDEVITFMEAGHSTTAVAISCVLMNIGKHPDVQQKLVDEIKNVMGDKIEPTTTENLKDLRYMDMVIQESQRLFPAVPLFARKALKEIDLGDDKIIPVDTTLFFSPYSMGRRPELFDNPETFDPERFAAGAKQFHNFAYLPFSSGQRHCIGHRFATLEIKSFLSKFLRVYEVEAEQNFVPQFVICTALQPVNGIKLKILKRENNNN